MALKVTVEEAKRGLGRKILWIIIAIIGLGLTLGGAFSYDATSLIIGILILILGGYKLIR